MTVNSSISNAKAPRKQKTKAKLSEDVLKKIALLEKPIEFCTIINPGHVEMTLPFRTISPNASEPWQKRYKREKEQKKGVRLLMLSVKNKILKIHRIYNLKFTRYAPKFLDAHDNLPMSLKKIVDQTCAEIAQDFVPGRADGYSCFKFEYDQVKSKYYGVKIEITYLQD